VTGLKALNVAGFNVTIPHKVAVMLLLDSLDPLAEKIGAVNTVVNEDGKLRGYNTDGDGFYRVLLEQGFSPQGKNVVLLGAGGAARAIAYTLAEKDARLTILNRRQELDWAENIARFILDDLNKEVKVFELGDIAKVLPGADLLVNATSVGMSPADNDSPVPAPLLEKVPVVFDIVYNPLKTRLLKEAAAAGVQTISGIDMLAWQGALAFEKWTGKAAPVDLMRQEAVKMLERHED